LNKKKENVNKLFPEGPDAANVVLHESSRVPETGVRNRESEDGNCLQAEKAS
jgi:hypothetical protein